MRKVIKRKEVSLANVSDQKRAVKIAAIIAFIVGLGFCIGGSARLIYLNSISGEYIETTATIEDINKYWKKHHTSRNGSEQRLEYEVTVSYVVDGVSYRRLLDTYEASMSVGDSVPIVYNPQDPSKIIAIGIERIMWTAFVIVGCIVSLISCFLPKLFNACLKFGKKTTNAETLH